MLRDVSLHVAPGEKVAIVGHTGAGKTTLINLLMRFYDPTRGRILLDGVPIDEVRIDDLRSRIGLVLQDVFLFSQDVGYNIRLGAPDIDPEAVGPLQSGSEPPPFIDRLEQGYDQPLGERGSTLSVGERQLVSFARALAFDPDILVLDEATSSVDSEIEAKIEAATDELLQRPHVARDRAQALDGTERRPNRGAPSRRGPRGRHASRAPRGRRPIRAAPRTAVRVRRGLTGSQARA